MRPAGARAYACTGCDARLLKSVEDQGNATVDFSRMAEFSIRTGGETWERGETSYWFRERQRLIATPPVPSRSLAPPPPPRPSLWRRLLRL